MNKYNGYEVETIKYSVDDPKSLPGNRIRNLLADKNGVIWMTIVNKGLYKFHPRKMDFQKIQLSGIDETKEIPNIFGMTLDNSGRIWIETGFDKLLRISIDENSEVVNTEHYHLGWESDERIVSLETTVWGTAYLTNKGDLKIFSNDGDHAFHASQHLGDLGRIDAIYGKNDFLYAATTSHILKYSFKSGELALSEKIALPKDSCNSPLKKSRTLDMKKGIRTYMKFSKSEKLKVLKEAKENGVKVTLDKYGVYAATYYNWKKSYDLFREDGVDLNSLKAARKEITELELQLVHYKSMLAEEQLKGRLKDELLKKKYPRKS